MLCERISEYVNSDEGFRSRVHRVTWKLLDAWLLVDCTLIVQIQKHVAVMATRKTVRAGLPARLVKAICFGRLPNRGVRYETTHRLRPLALRECFPLWKSTRHMS
jgi:hypothetical protein